MKAFAKWQTATGLIVLPIVGFAIFGTLFPPRKGQPHENRPQPLEEKRSQKSDEKISEDGLRNRTASPIKAISDSQKLISVNSFIERFNSIDSSLSGVALREARSQAINLAAEKLTLDDLESLADSIRSKVYHTDLSGYLAVRYANEDPKRGMEWIIKQSNFEDSSSASLTFGQLCKFETFPVNDLIKFGSDKKKSLFIEGIIKNASFEVTRDALKYLNENPSVSQQNGNLIPKLFESSLHNGEYRESLELYKVLNDASLRKQILGRVFEHASAENPKLSKELLISIISEPERNLAIQNIALTWGISEPDKVAGWIDTLPNTKEQDAAKEGLVSVLAQSDPYSSLEWARSIGDRELRHAVVAKLAKQFEISNPELFKKIHDVPDP